MRQPDEAVLLDMLLFGRRIRDRMAGVTHDEFDGDEDLQLAITYLIQIVGEAASRVSQSLRDSYPQVPWTQIIGMRRDYFPAVYQTCTAITLAPNKICTMMAKSTPYLACHLDNFPAKVPGPEAGWLRQVTQPPFIAGPLACIGTKLPVKHSQTQSICFHN